MNMEQTKSQKYNTLTRFLHWLMALCFAIMLGTALMFSEESMRTLMPIHKSFGFVLAVLIVVRVLWSFITRHQRPVNTAIAKLGHLALYALMIIVPLTALIRQYGSGRGPLKVFGVQVMQGLSEPNEFLADIGNIFHGNLAYLLFILVAGHIAVAVLHQLKGEKIMQRIIGR